MINKIKKMKLKDYWHLMIIILLYIPSKILKLIDNNIWIISENGDDAKDNGFAFFEYMAKHHPEINSYYIIEKESSDYEKLKKYKNIIIHNSLKDVLFSMACKNYVSSQLASSFPYSNIFFNLYMYKFFNFSYIFLQHGITKEKVSCFYKGESGIDLFCCAANPEYDFVNEFFGYKDYEVVKTGFCRYDNLEKSETKQKSILLMPTWRKPLEAPNDILNDECREKFLVSKYYNTLQSFIDNPKLIETLEKNNIIMYFCLHDKMRPYKDCFHCNSKNIIIIDKTYKKKINELIRECDYLITDTSSVAFDFAYQNKRLQYFHFDYEEIQSSHWEKGYFDYDRDGFGPITKTVEDAVEETIKSIKKDFENPLKYSKRTDNFYCYKDKNNCERTFDAINKLNSLRRNKDKIEKNIAYIISGLFFLLIGILTKYSLFLLFAVICIFINNILYCLKSPKKNIFLLIFNFAIFTFLMSRPIIQTFRLVSWWEFFSEESILFSLSSIFFTLIFIYFGSIFANNFCSNIHQNSFKNISSIQKYSLIFFYISIVFNIITKLDLLLYMHGKDYVEYYLSYESSLPSIINLIGGMSNTFFVVYLMTLPSRKRVILPAILFILPNAANLLIGQRNPIVLSCLFVFSYAIIRDYWEENKWITLKNKIAIIIMIPIAIFSLDILNYVRSDEVIKLNFVDSVVDFFYTQGVSYDVLNIGYSKMDTIRSMDKNYVFGPIVDYFSDNTIAKKVFKLPGLGTGNNVNRALNGNSFTHILGFLSRSDYLKGHGYGSSYILETYCNYGFLGMIIFSFLLGIFLTIIPILIKFQNFISIIVLYISMYIYFLPRAETVSPIMFMFTPHFWAALIIILISVIIKEKKWFDLK